MQAEPTPRGAREASELLGTQGVERAVVVGVGAPRGGVGPGADEGGGSAPRRAVHPQSDLVAGGCERGMCVGRQDAVRTAEVLSRRGRRGDSPREESEEGHPRDPAAARRRNARGGRNCSSRSTFRRHRLTYPAASQGCHPLSADALQAVARCPGAIDAVVTDLVMPERTGREV